MPLFKRGRKQDEEDLQWLYRNLQELDDAEPSREGAEEETPADGDGDDVGIGTVMESPPEPVLNEPPSPEPVLGEPEPLLDETRSPTEACIGRNTATCSAGVASSGIDGVRTTTSGGSNAGFPGIPAGAGRRYAQDERIVREEK